jgi:hypothetical protein
MCAISSLSSSTSMTTRSRRHQMISNKFSNMDSSCSRCPSMELLAHVCKKKKHTNKQTIK